jgi:hypothetical protein
MPIYSFKDKYGASVVVNGLTSVLSEIFDQDPIKFIRPLHDGDHRIHCDCTEAGAVSFPCLLQAHETYYLRQSQSNPHDENCPLVGVSSGDYNPPTLGPKPPKIRPYQPGVKFADGKGQDTAGKGSGGSRQNKLYTMLCHLLAGKKKDGYVLFNRYTQNKKFNWGSIYYSLAADSPFIEKTKLTLLLNTPSHLYYQPDQKFIDRFCKKVSEKVPPQIYTIAVSNHDNYTISDGQCRFTDSKGVERNFRPRRASHRFSQTTGPRLFFFIEAYVDGEWIVPSLYSHPIVSLEIPILVDSNYERNFFIFIAEKFARREEALTAELRRKPNSEGLKDNDASVSFSIVKPYFAKILDEQPNVPLIPDFKLTRSVKYFDFSESLHVLVEVMGYNDPDYDARKDEIIPAMERRLGTKVARVKPESMEHDFTLLMAMTWSKFKGKVTQD